MFPLMTSCSNNTKPLDEKVVRLLLALRKHPELYRENEPGPGYRTTTRTTNRKTWDKIAKRCGFAKTEDAICRWRGLLIYFRHLLEDAARKKVRRNTPNTGNPVEKYVKLKDWRYYEYIKFMQPYISISNESSTRKRDCSGYVSLENNIAPIPFKFHSVPVEPEIRPSEVMISSFNQSATSIGQKLSLVDREVTIGKKVADINFQGISKRGTTQNAIASPGISLSCNKSPKFEDLSAHDQNLKSFFDAMFKSTQRLSSYHQSCVKKKLMISVKTRS